MLPQGKKTTTHDFLSLCTERLSQGHGLEMHNFLQPVEQAKQLAGAGISGNNIGRVISKPASSGKPEPPAGIGTFGGPMADILLGPRMESVAETDCETTVSATHPGATSTMWQDSGIDPRLGDLAVRVEAKSSGISSDQKPNTPRSKHSATEQRRRTKINERIQILRDLLPQCDQKRDKASFLLEVIQYIRFLQEKLRRYESTDLELNCKNSKSMIQNISRDGLSDFTQDREKGPDDASGIASALFSSQNTREIGTNASAPDMGSGTPQNSAKKNMSNNGQLHWLSMSSAYQDSDARHAMPRHEEPKLHTDTDKISSAYSERLLTRLTQSLNKSGVDISQANLSVEINMSRRARRPEANVPFSSKGNEGED